MIELVGTNTLKDCDPNPARDAVYTGVSGVNGIVADCGATYQPDYGTLGAIIVTGGGHADYGGNEVYAFEFDTMTWKRLTNPSTAIQPLVFNTPGANTPIGADLVHGEYSDGTPLTNHNYSALAAIPGGSKGLLVNWTKNNICWSGQVSVGWTHALDLGTAIWQRYSTNATPVRGMDQIGADMVCYDAKRNRLWGVVRGGSGILSYLDLATKTHTVAGTVTNGGYVPTCARLAINDYMILCAANYSEQVGAPIKISLVNLANPGAGQVYVNMVGDLPPAVRYCPVGFDWDTVNNCGWMYLGNWTWGTTDGINDQNHVYRCDPPAGNWATGNWQITKVALPGTMPDCVNGPYSRWRYINKLGKFALVSKTSNKVALWQPPTSGDTVAPAKPTAALNVTIQWNAPMYNVLLSGTAGPEADLAKVKLYVNGALAQTLNTAPGAAFNATVQSPGSQTLAIGYSFVDASGNESGQFTQTVVVPAAPDVTAPATPTGPLTLVSIVWV